MHPLLLATMASFFFVFLRAFQQKNTAHSKYLTMIPTSMLMTATEYYVIIEVVREGYSIMWVVVLGLSNGLGCVIATYLHDKMSKRKINHG